MEHNSEHNMLTLDFWQDTVTYEGQTLPTGTLGCDALNIPDEMIARLNELCAPLNRFMETMNGISNPDLLPPARESAIAILNLLCEVPPFSYLDKAFYSEGIRSAFSIDGLTAFQQYSYALMMGGIGSHLLEEYRLGILLARLLQLFAQLGFSLGEYKKELLSFAETLDVAHADRTPDGLAALFGKHFPPEVVLDDQKSWMSLANISVQYVSTRHPGHDVPMLVKRMHFVSFVGMLRTDLFEGLCVGHAPKKCPICGRWFLTTNARHTKYCGNLAPGDELRRTCRQIGNLRGREQRELADDHPLKQIYERRMNTVNRCVKRGTLTPDMAAAMKKLAKNKLLRAISDSSYAKGSYAKEMEQDALLAEAKAQR